MSGDELPARGHRLESWRERHSTEKLREWQLSEGVLMKEDRRNVLETSFCILKMNKVFVTIAEYLSAG